MQDPILTAIDMRIAALQDLRARCVEVLGLVGAPMAPAETIVASGASNPPVRASKPAPRATKGTAGETRPTTTSLGGKRAAILAALTSGPLSPGELTNRVGLNSVTALAHHMRPLRETGKVIVTGVTTSRRYQLA